MHPREEMQAECPHPHCPCLASSSSLGSAMWAFFQGSQGPEAGTSVLLLQVKLRKPRTAAQKELKEKETGPKTIEKDVPCSSMVNHTPSWRSQSFGEQDIYLPVNDATWEYWRPFLSVASFHFTTALPDGDDRSSYSHLTEEKRLKDTECLS